MRIRLALVFALAAGCGAHPLRDARQAPSVDTVDWVETAPVETTLDHADLPEAHEVWRSMIDGATRTLDFAQFYASDETGSRLDPIVRAIERAAGRGVRVRFLAERKMAKTYPRTLERLASCGGVAVRTLDGGAHMGGVLHAKYFLVDGNEAFLGSQNFDWRALEHIQELGARVRDLQAVRSLADVFAMDWDLAGGGKKPVASDADAPVHTPGAVELVASPRDWLPPGVAWDLPRLVSLVDGAERSVSLQLLTYRADIEGERTFRELEDALLRAAKRGVRVRLLLADWCKRASTIRGLQRIEPVENVDVRLATIPPSARGFIPYARVIHAKYLVVDGRRAWLGTSNWERGYFFEGRNVGLIVEDDALAGRLGRFFEDGWSAPYAAAVDLAARYEAPAISAAGTR